MYQCALFLIPRPLLTEAGGWDASLSVINDLELFTRLILASDGVCFTPGARLFYRSGMSGSLSARRSAAAFESSTRSVLRAAGYLLSAEDSPRTRRVAARMIRNIVYRYYPDGPDLVAALEREVARLGGTDLRPQGGAVFRALSRVVGWRRAMRWREQVRARWHRAADPGR